MAQENSFDIVSKVDIQEVRNAIDQAMKEIRQRFDLKDSHSEINLEGSDTIQMAPRQRVQARGHQGDSRPEAGERGVSLKNLTHGKVEPAMGQSVRQKITLQQGIPTEKAKEIVRIVKDSKKKVQASIQGDTVRISGKDRDDLQAIIAALRGKDLGVELHVSRTTARTDASARSSEETKIEHPGNSDGERGFRTAARRPRSDRAGAGARCRLQRQHHHRNCRIPA